MIEISNPDYPEVPLITQSCMLFVQFSLHIIKYDHVLIEYLLSRNRPHEHMLDDQDDAHSAHSIGIVENPLYAEQEDYNTPSYATLKEKEAEVRYIASWWCYFQGSFIT